MNSSLSIIVFSKGRPMQLHAYLESLFKFSDAVEDMVTILCCEMEQIRYDKVRRTFPKVQWITETKFEQNLREAINKAGEFVMFGCDDVVFTRTFSLRKSMKYLSEHDEVLGFSMRLGENIKPMPPNLSKDDSVFEWTWKNCKEQHYNYPWELDCTLYRKEDVTRILQEEGNPIKNPNYFEAMIVPEAREARLPRVNMACNRENGCAVVITVNRVQDTHQNGFDDSMLTDVYSLDKQYNDEDNTLDIEKIANMDNHVIHVGAEYFILRKAGKGYSQSRIYRRRAKEMKDKIMKFPKRVYRHFESKKYLEGGYTNKLNILTTEETLSLLEKETFSFLRYGDGEISIMKGNPIPFQAYDAELAERLRELLKVKEQGIKIGIPYYYMTPLAALNDFTKRFARALPSQRKFLCQECSKHITYIDTCITQVYQTYQDYDFVDYYERMQRQLTGKDVTVICGEGVLDKLQYKALDVCNSVEYIYGASMNAYSEYENLLNQAKQIDKDRLVLVVLGPTAKVLVYDLYREGYVAWDIGHYLKDYDAYKKQKPRTEAEIAQFYKPD